MNKEAQRIAIATAVFGGRWYTNPEGVSYLRFDEDRSKDRTLQNIPDYLTDLNAMHEAENILNHEQQGQYCAWLKITIDRDCADIPGSISSLLRSWYWHATAAQRAEAFLKTLNLWTK